MPSMGIPFSCIPRYPGAESATHAQLSAIHRHSEASIHPYAQDYGRQIPFKTHQERLALGGVEVRVVYVRDNISPA